MFPLLPVREDSDFFQLHKKFWDKSIDRDEREWVEEHGQLAENDGSEVVPGCFTLDLGIENPMTSKLWVRQDYWRIYDLCHSHCQAVLTDREQGMGPLPPLAIITGQPGIGESSSSQSFHSQTLIQKGKLNGFIMPYADALVKPNHFFGTLQRSGIYL